MWIFSLFFGGNRVQTFFFALSTTMFGDTYERSYPEYVRCFLRVLTINACGQALRVLYLFFVIFLSVVCQKKLISPKILLAIVATPPPFHHLPCRL